MSIKLNKIHWIIAICLLLTTIVCSAAFVNARSSVVRADSSKEIAPPAADVVENRCGWFVNPTPANAWLVDKEGRWIISVEGGHQAEGEYPDYSGKQWVRTNGMYGYGCACMQVITNHQTKEVNAIKSGNALPLATCRQDRSLKEPRY